jgi:cell filamentation protein
MAKQRRPRRDRYDVSGNVEAEYVDAAQTVLVNKLGLRALELLQLAEEEALAKAYETLLGEVRVDTPMTCELVRYIHARIFGDIYAWAGRWRTVTISKPGIAWPPAIHVAQAMESFECDVLRKHPARTLSADDAFCSAMAEIQGEFLVVHPFREGNARTIKLMTDLLAAQTGRPLLMYDESDAGREKYIVAASQAFKKNYQPMVAVIRSALSEGLRRST